MQRMDKIAKLIGAGDASYKKHPTRRRDFRAAI